MSSPFPRMMVPDNPVEVDFDRLKNDWTGGELWLETVLYYGANDVHQPYQEAPSILENPEFPSLKITEKGRNEEYHAYVEDKRETEWIRIQLDRFDQFPFQWAWSVMEEYHLGLAICPSNSERVVFSFTPNKLTEYPAKTSEPTD